MLVFSKLQIRPYYPTRIIGLFFLLFIFGFGKHLIYFNRDTTSLTKGEYAYVNQPKRGPLLWSVEVLNNYGQEISLVTPTWDTVLKLPPGTPISYSFWKNYKQGYQQITNLGYYGDSKVLIACFSPSVPAKKTIVEGGSVKLKRYESVEYISKGISTVRLSSYSNNNLLIYGFFGTDSILPIALNTSKDHMPNFYHQIENLKVVGGNRCDFRAKWDSKKLFFVFIPYVQDSILVEFFPG
ncbi:hypothetical protein POV27_14150 [Aureisphaera galaxeae]|uniref:hypothetical protein n=1 Tax=Aureisphaera galaxeae TaxID=1538023 RepID=UPI00234FCAF8|nr:hypothetical protein [Aureisphaera galaxeae]MDC8005199.1 hypothetical protein [Aureisphaera galaxeae]